MSPAASSRQTPRLPRVATGLAVLAAAVLSGCVSYEFVPRNDGGFHYMDYKGSPYDQSWTPNPAINQIQCPPPSRPICGG